jgi:zinc transporter ZupT
VNAGRRTADETSEPSGIAVFLASHGRLIEWVAVIIGAAILLIGPPLAIGAILLIIAAIVAIVVLIEFISASATRSSDNEKTTVDS